MSFSVLRENTLLRICLLIGFVALTGCKSDDEECLVFSPDEEWVGQAAAVEGADWPFSFASLLGLRHGLTPVEFCNQIDEFNGYLAYEHANFDDRLAGLFAPLQLEFDGRSAWLGSGDVVETAVSAFFSAPPSGSQLNQFEISYFFADTVSQPSISDVRDEAIRLFGPYSASTLNHELGPRYAWIVDDGKLLADFSGAACSLTFLDRLDVASMKTIENSCDGFLELSLTRSDDDRDRASYVLITVQDRSRIVDSSLIDDMAFDEISRER